MHRVLFAVHRKKGMSVEEFLLHYQRVHIPIARRFPRLRRYEIYPVAEFVSEESPAGPDAFAVMTFDSPQDFEAAVSSPEFVEAVADNDNFVDRFDTYVVDHISVLDD
jgi:uncharacterized protein (TIGR02118 family)